MRAAMRATAVTMLLALITAGVAAAAPAPPTSDPFYVPSGSPAGVSPGTVLRSRPIAVNFSGLPGVTGTQVLYRTTNQLGQASATVATIIHPPVPSRKLLSYQTFYDGVAATCRPSYTLQSGAGSPGTEEALMLPYLTQGFTIVTADYEGPTDDFGAGRESGQNTLDAIRAAEHTLGLPAGSTPVGLLGYSGGSVASVWAAEVQPGYAPELRLNGVAAGGIPADFAHNLKYVDGSSDWAGAIPAVGIGEARAYHLNLAPYLSATGAQVAAKQEQGCIDPAGYPGLTFEKMLRPQYQDWQKVPAFIRMFNDSILGRGRTPAEPLLMRVGNRGDGGDGVMIAGDVQQLAYEYCRRGVSVDFQVLNGDDHYKAAVPFEASALSFLDARYAATPATNTCASVTPGNALTPLPPPKSPPPIPKSQLRLRLRSVTVSPRRHGVAVSLSATGGTVQGVTVELTRSRRVLARVRLARVGARARTVVLRVRRRMPAAGRYVLLVYIGHRRAFRRGVTFHRR